MGGLMLAARLQSHVETILAQPQAAERLHQRIGVVLGSKNEVERVTRYHAA